MTWWRTDTTALGITQLLGNFEGKTWRNAVRSEDLSAEAMRYPISALTVRTRQSTAKKKKHFSSSVQMSPVPLPYVGNCSCTQNKNRKHLPACVALPLVHIQGLSCGLTAHSRWMLCPRGRLLLLRGKEVTEAHDPVWLQQLWETCSERVTAVKHHSL